MRKKWNEKYTLPLEEYHRAVEVIKEYPESDLVQKALDEYAGKPGKEAVLRHITEGTSYDDLEQMYFISELLLRNWSYRFVYGVGKAMREVASI